MDNQLEDERKINNGLLRRAHSRRTPRLPSKKSLRMSAKTWQARSPTKPKYHNLSRLNILIPILPSQPLLTRAMMPQISSMMPVKLSSSRTTSIVPSPSPSGGIRSGYHASSLAISCQSLLLLLSDSSSRLCLTPIDTLPFPKTLLKNSFFVNNGRFSWFTFVGCKFYRATTDSSSFFHSFIHIYEFTPGKSHVDHPILFPLGRGYFPSLPRLKSLFLSAPLALLYPHYFSWRKVRY